MKGSQQEPPCPMSRTDSNDKERHNPPNREVAFVFQFHDHVRTLYGLAHLQDDNYRRKSVIGMVNILESELRYFRSDVEYFEKAAVKAGASK